MKNILIGLLVLITIASVAAAAYFYGKSQGIKNEASVSPITPVITEAPPSPTVESTPTANVVAQGMISGKLCYPASGIPPGKIVAKDIASGKAFSQDYVGSQAGGGMTYTFSLPVGSYHLKFDAQSPSGTFSGFYTDYSSCVGNPSGANCSGQKTRPLLSAQVTTGGTVSDVNLCDFYYSPDAPPTF